MMKKEGFMLQILKKVNSFWYWYTTFFQSYCPFLEKYSSSFYCYIISFRILGNFAVQEIILFLLLFYYKFQDFGNPILIATKNHGLVLINLTWRFFCTSKLISCLPLDLLIVHEYHGKMSLVLLTFSYAPTLNDINCIFNPDILMLQIAYCI